MSVSTRFAGLAATSVIALAGAVASPAVGDEAPAPEPCAQQQAQAERAEAALVRVTAVLARQQTRVAHAKNEVAQAEAGRAKAEARRTLAQAKHVRDATKVTKRAQQQRVAKADERLAACLAEQESTRVAPAQP